MDMPVRKDLAPALGRLSPPPSVMQVSLQTGQGTEQLLQEIERRLALMFQLPTDTAVPSRARHRELLQKVGVPSMSLISRTTVREAARGVSGGATRHRLSGGGAAAGGDVSRADHRAHRHGGGA